ncbi:MAG TPA: DUF433 domain-containing protein [Pyrinomonadaceae bacterium]|nr:DUF433 domain-containing protein [Pyrinomonadaceae bacterium]
MSVAVIEDLITIDPELMGGTPVFSGTRVPIKSLFDWLETESLDEFLANFPSVSREQALNVLHLAEERLISPDLYEDPS